MRSAADTAVRRSASCGRGGAGRAGRIMSKPRLLLATLALASLAPAQSIAAGCDPVLDAGCDADAARTAVPARDAAADRELDPVQDGWRWQGDVLLRRDQVNGLAAREPVDRLRLRARFGGAYATELLELGVIGEGAIGSDANDGNRRNNDNEESDDANLDSAYLRWLAGDATTLTVGKAASPLALSPMLWDADLRPVGAVLEHAIARGDFDRLTFVGGYFAGDHLYRDDSRIAALQAGWHWHEGAPVSFSAWLTYLDFTDLDTLAREGLARTNRRVAGALASDYELLDLQLAWRTQLDAIGGVPFELRGDVVRNLGADAADTGARLSAVFGSSRVERGLEVGLAYERIERDAVMAAFNEDDWWFHSAMRGFMPWVAYGLSDSVSVRVAGFFERRDDQGEDVERLLVDLKAAF